MLRLPGIAESCWVAGASHVRYPVFADLTKVDVLVVGAGIVGLTAALELCQAGLSVIVLEARRIGRQVTGRSTAKITTQHGLIYRQLVEQLGIDKAQAYADANQTGVKRMTHWINQFAIPCDLGTKSAYAYINNPELKQELNAEADAARKLGLQANVLDAAPLPFVTAGALCFPEQAQFNPTSYLEGIATAVRRRAGHIFEESPVRAIDSEHRWRAATDDGTVDCEHIIVATNLPVTSPRGFAGRT